MQAFLSKVVSEVLKSKHNLSDLTFVLPNKRSGVFLRTLLREQLDTATFLPRILSIEEFVKDISGFEILDNISLLFEFYEIYCKHTTVQETDSFENFSKWANILIQDFNELDSNLFDASSILTYLSETKRIEQWYPDEPNTSEMVTKYLSFFEKIVTYHSAFTAHLINKKSGYQGLVYRIALKNISDFRQSQAKNKFIFAAFNALNKAEEKIIQDLLLNNLAAIYWDNDEFYEKSNNQAAQFFKKYERSWPYYTSNNFEWKEANINTGKTIHFHGLPKNITQIKHVGTLLKELHNDKKIQDTAVILGNEKLLPSLLNSMPAEITKANITMGYELQNTALNSFFQALFNLHLNKTKWKKDKSFYYKDLTNVLFDPFFKNFWIESESVDKGLKELLYADNKIFISGNEVCALAEKSENLKPLFNLIFKEWEQPINIIINRVLNIIDLLRKSKGQNNLQIEYLYRFYDVFVQLLNLNSEYGFIDSLNSLYQTFLQILKSEKLSFQGEPLDGLQIMGLLESRGLDFKNIIITSVNEGFLPATGSNNSFIPMDIKFEKKMPTYFEKDAIFSFHFFRLLHRAENVYLIYNNITDDFGSGEASRFIRQLLVAKETGLLNHVTFEKKLIHPKLQALPLDLKLVPKNEGLLLQLQEIAQKGFSPSSLSSYIRNPIDFYKQRILGLKEHKEVEETIAANTFGTIVHDTLEVLYTPCLDQILEEDHVKKMIINADKEVHKQFEKSFSLSSIISGKNYLAYEIAKQFILNFLHFELSEIKKGKKIKLIGLEIPIQLLHKVDGLDFSVKLKGKIDRIDEIDGTTRIMDYKTGKVTPTQLKIKDWTVLCTDEKFSKSFQVLTYAYMFLNQPNYSREGLLLESGIISLKNLKSGFMPFNGGYITPDILASYIISLDNLIKELFNPEIPFLEKEIPTFNY